MAGYLMRYSKINHMEKDKQEKDRNEQRENSSLQPDPGTLHKTDPQENMEGPVSSAMHKTGEAFESDESQEEADRNREKNM